jgi:outer membrane lipase/esterase
VTPWWARSAYAHDWDADRNDVTAGLVSLNGDFTMPGYQPQKNWVEAGAGISAEFNKRWGASIAYTGNFASDDRRLQAVMVGLHAAF